MQRTQEPRAGQAQEEGIGCAGDKEKPGREGGIWGGRGDGTNWRETGGARNRDGRIRREMKQLQVSQSGEGQTRSGQEAGARPMRRGGTSTGQSAASEGGVASSGRDEGGPYLQGGGWWHSFAVGGGPRRPGGVRCPSRGARSWSCHRPSWGEGGDVRVAARLSCPRRSPGKSSS